MCEHKYKNYEIPLVLNITPRKMNVNWECVSCGKKGIEKKLV